MLNSLSMLMSRSLTSLIQAVDAEDVHGSFQSYTATHRLKIGIVEDGWRKVALAAIHFIEFCVSKSATNRCGIHPHDTAPLVDQALLSIEASRAIHLLVGPHWRRTSRPAVTRFTACTQIRHFVMAVTTEPP